MIDYDHLLAYDIPEVRQRYTQRDGAFYALSIGIGADPLDRSDLRFVGSGALIPFPTMPLVLAHPGFWLGNPDTGVDAVRLVHGGQKIVLHAPLPAEGTVIGKTRVTGLIDKGVGRGALLYTEKRLSDADTGTHLATTMSTTFLRGDGGFGGPPGPIRSAHVMPLDEPTIRRSIVTRPEQALLYRWNGDDNPLHLDPDLAARAGFDRPILQGLCTFGAAAHAAIGALADGAAEKLSSICGRFVAPVFPGETLALEAWEDGSFRVRAMERDRLVIDNGLAGFI